jgi:hypothetical protein
VKLGWLPFAIASALVVTLGALIGVEILQRSPSPADCADLWNRPTNGRAQNEVVAYPKVSIRGWDSKAGVHCIAMFFGEVGTPWQTYTLWLADPDGIPAAYSRDIGGGRFGSGWFFEVHRAYRPNATIAPDGRLTVE